MAQDSSTTISPRVGSASQAASMAVRFLFLDRCGQLLLVWVAIACVLRPAAMEYHQTGGGLLPWLFALSPNASWMARLAGMLQWSSLALPIVILAIVHARWTLSSPSADAPARKALHEFAIPAAYALTLFIAYLCFVWTPSTLLTLITTDSFIFYDASYRILNGERPHVDFPTALGSAALYLPAAGAYLTGGYAGMIELASAPLALLLGLACARAGAGRYPSGATAALVLLIFLVTVPAVLLGLRPDDSHTFIDGEAVILADHTSYAMFYNRWGWGALIAVFAFLAPRSAPAGAAPGGREAGVYLDVAILAALLAFLFYLNAPSLVIGVAAAGLFCITTERPWRTLAIGAGVTLGFILAVGVPSGLLAPYLRDLAFVVSISGGKSNTLISILRYNLAFMLLAAVPLGLLMSLGRFTWRDGLIAGFLLLASVYIILQNAQLFDIITLASLAAYGLARVWNEGDRAIRITASAAFALTLLPVQLDRTFGLMDQVMGTRREETREPAAWSAIPALKNVHIAERETSHEALLEATTPEELIEAFHLSNRTRRKEVMRQGEYLRMVLAGIDDLRAVMRPGDSVATLDMTNPFPFLMEARSPRGAYITLDGGRTLSRDVHPAPEKMFADTDHVMIPRFATLQHTPDLALRLYDDWLTAHYEERVESLYWIRFSRRRAEAG